MTRSLAKRLLAIGGLTVAVAGCSFDETAGPDPSADTSHESVDAPTASDADGGETSDTAPGPETAVPVDTGSRPGSDTRSSDSGSTPDTRVDTVPSCDAETCPGQQPGAGGTCFDGVDNDGDGDVDCADRDCQGERCGPDDGAVCQGRKCVETTCWDREDNDDDGLVDCDDQGACGTDRQCGTDGEGATCSSDGECREDNCTNGEDDDRDGRVDGDDPDCAPCADDPCSGKGSMCMDGDCIETVCDDDGDNDGDGDADCADDDCRGESCGNGERCCEAPGGGWGCKGETHPHCLP